MNKKITILVTASIAAVAAFLSLTACSITMPKGAKVVTGFNADKYLGKWYEIARFDFIHEKDMDNTTAEYSYNEDGSIKVVNRGYNYKKGKWIEAIGKAKFVDETTVGKLKVSFFSVFYSGYNIVELDKDYKYALVVGKNTDYMWILSRTPEIPEDVKEKYLKTAASLGYDLDRLVWVKHGNR